LSAKPRSFVALSPGDPAPWFVQRSGSTGAYHFDTVAGRYILLCFFTSSRDPLAARALKAVAAQRSLFDDEHVSFFGVSMDSVDERDGRLKDSIPGIRFIWDFDAAVSRLYGAAPIDLEPGENDMPTRRFWLVLDPGLHVLRLFEFSKDSAETNEVIAYLRSLPPPARAAGFPVQAPVLMIPNVFEPAFCRKLIALYEADGGTESGVMREVNGKTVVVLDAHHKRRRDCLVTDEAIIAEIQGRIKRRVIPEIQTAHQFKVTRMERYIVSCYAAEEGGHFRPHRDNTTKGTSHRRFAVSLNLNDDFDGGELSFPEYGQNGFKMLPGMVGVFSCSLLHTVSAVTRGKR
jgi:peroxiredoxin/predicted 2-oxoglutarate/Fe(II)-dependent dioxygenase YbiX